MLEEAEKRERAKRDPVLVSMTPAEEAWFAVNPHEHELFRERQPGEFDALAEEEELMGVSLVPVGGGLARMHPEPVWRFSDG